ncbi:hypothetical protein Tco_1440843, partial [Tanacetum coccineum]
NMTEVYEAVTHVMQRSWVAVMKIMPIDQASNLVGGQALNLREGEGLQGGRAFEEEGPSKRRGLRGEGASEEEGPSRRRVLQGGDGSKLDRG